MKIILLGWAYQSLENHQKAIECYEKAVRIDPNFREAWFNMGTAYGNLGYRTKAHECYEKSEIL